MIEALLWGAVASSSLVLGAAIGLRGLPERWLGLLMGFGAGALISSVSFELAIEAIDVGGFDALASGLAIGAVAFYAGDRLLERRAPDCQHRPRGADAQVGGGALALGALLDGIPEQAAIGISIAAGGEVGVALVVAVFLSNVPEAAGSARAMRTQGRSRTEVLRLWCAVAAFTTLASVLGQALLGDASGELVATILGVAAGAVLVMLVDALVPEALRSGGKAAGLVTVLGFAVTVLLSSAR